jgi:2-polyprenyl-3-methyl-5-hydroxy-6-metoxy-1,4-benzoquinol methylase
MRIIGATLGYHLLNVVSPSGLYDKPEGQYVRRSKLDVLMPSRFWGEIHGKTVIDFGCGIGEEAIEMARRGAERVVGIDTQTDVLE